jgi:hypothetical protein
VADDVLRPLAVGESLKDLRRSRNEADYSPYPGPDERTQYDPDELQDVILGSIDTADRLLRQVENTLALR